MLYLLTPTPHRWAELRERLEEKRESVLSVRQVQVYQLDCNETTQWIVDKIRVVEKTKELGDDLAGIIALQRRLKGMESDLIAIEAKVRNCVAPTQRLRMLIGSI